MLEELAAQLLPLIVQRWRPGVHFLVTNVLTALSGGVVYIGLALCTRSLWLAIMTHGIYDLFVFWVMIRMRRPGPWPAWATTVGRVVPCCGHSVEVAGVT